MEQAFIEHSPHQKSALTTRRIMLDVLIALLPAAVMGCIYFGWQALLVLVLTVVSAVLTEVIWLLVRKRTFKEILDQFDLTSVVTGLLLGMCFGCQTPWYVCLLSGAFAVGIAKMLFGGTGRNIVNPALAGRIFAFIAFPTIVAGGWIGANFVPGAGEVISGATPLTDFLANNGVMNTELWKLLVGYGVPGCIGETCKVALLAGYVYLVVRKVIDWKYPLLYIAATGVTSMIAYRSFEAFLPSILSGGLFLGAIFMATDYVTSPKTPWGNVVYFLLLGVITAILRYATGIEVVSFCIFLMNLVTPLIDRFIRPRPFGYVRQKKESEKDKTAKEAGK